MMPGPSELLIILGVALLIFGPSKLPLLGSAIGESIRNFRKGMKSSSELEKDNKNLVTELSSDQKNQEASVHKISADTLK